MATNKWSGSLVRKVNTISSSSSVLKVTIPLELVEAIGLQAGDEVTFSKGTGVNAQQIRFEKVVKRGKRKTKS